MVTQSMQKRRMLAYLLAFAMLFNLLMGTGVFSAHAEGTDGSDSGVIQQEPTPAPDPTEAPEAPAEPTQEPEAAPEPTPAPDPTEAPVAAVGAARSTLVSPGNTTYYLDAEGGNDTNDGTSPETAWQSLDRANRMTFAPGDRILFKAGCSWNGMFMPQGSGADGAPIVIDKYGDGPLPILNGGGTSGPAITGTVLLYNVEYYEVANLEVTNLEPTDKAGETMDSGTAERAGILAFSSIQDRILQHIYIRDCYVHDVNSSFSGGKTSGGIIVMGHYVDIDGNVVTIDDNGNLTAKAMGRAAYNDVIIEGNYVKNVAIEGIRNKCNTNIGSSGWGSNEFLKNFSNVIIRDNYIEDVVGDGIVLTETKGGLIEGNIVKNSCGIDRGNVNYAQCWTMFADDITIQYNEVYGNLYGYDDGEAFDSDMRNERNVFQYNLSHDNGGGACLFMSNQKNTIFRYNVSINDGAGTYPNGTKMRQQIFHYDNTSSNSSSVPQIYNNTFYLSGADHSTVLFGGKSARTCFINFRNNIVLAENGAELAFTHTDSSIHADSLIENNCFWPATVDTSVFTTDQLTASGNLFTDPQLTDPAAGLNYTDFELAAADRAAIYGLAEKRVAELCEPYQPKTGSPVIRAGQIIDGAPEKDILGNSVVGLIDIGAIEVSSTPEENAAIEPIVMATPVGKQPDLPATVTVTIDGAGYRFPVTWDAITADSLAQAGTLQIGGSIRGISAKASATVHVVAQAAGFESVAVDTWVNVYPELPDTVTANFDGSLQLKLDVVWSIMDDTDLQSPGVKTLKGTVPALPGAPEVTATVNVRGSATTRTEPVKEGASGDAYIQRSNGGTAYGSTTSTVLKVKNANADAYNRRTLIAFDLSDNADALKEAVKVTLKLFTARYDKDIYYGWADAERDQTRLLRIYDVGTDWSENTVTWNNAPAVTDTTPIVLNDVTYRNGDIMDNGDLLEIDVTDYVKNSGKTSFGFLIGVFNNGEFSSGDNSGFDFASKEAGSDPGPILELSYVYETGIEPVTLTVPLGETLTMPETVNIRYSDASTAAAKVTWEAVDAALLAQKGSFTVRGKVEGTNRPATAAVTVTDPLPTIVSAVDITPIQARTGTAESALGLPASAEVTLSNGQSASIPVNYWFPEPAYDAAIPRDYVYLGVFDLTGQQIRNPNDIRPTVTVTLQAPANKNILVSALREAQKAVDSGIVGKVIPSVQKEFNDARAEAQKVYDDENVTNADVQRSYLALQTAIWKLNLLAADKAALQKAIDAANGIDTGLYTPETVQVMQNALAAADALNGNRELSIADQTAVDDAAAALRNAIAALQYIPGKEPKPQPLPDSSYEGTASASPAPSAFDRTIPRTSDAFPLTAAVALLALSAAGLTALVLLRKKKDRE